MAATKKGRSISSQTINTDTTTAGEKFAVDASTQSAIAYIKVSSFSAGTFTLKIQHSHDGSNWEDLVADSGVATNDTVYLEYSQQTDGGCFGLWRIVVVSASSANATVEAGVFYD